MTIVLDKVVEEVATKAVNELVQIVAKNYKLIVSIDSEIIDLTSEIETFNARLLDASKIPRAKQLQVMKVIVKKFRSVVNEAQDAVAKYISEKKSHEEKTFTKCLDKVPHFGKVNVCATEIQSLRTKMNAIREDHEKDLLSLTNYPNNDPKTDPSHSSQARPIVEKDEVFGFKEDLKTIKDRLSRAFNNFMVIPIVGMAGTGKTTFATKIFEDSDIVNKFDLCIWLHVSQGFNRKQKFIGIIHQIKKSTEDYSWVSDDDQLAKEILNLLTKQKYFIVLDDVWEEKDWNSLKVAFPKNLNGSRVLVTTRRGSVIDSEWEPHILNKLDTGESWSLLKKNVFGEKECGDLFEKHGRKIAEKCNGLPLALRVVAGILCKNRTITDWERVAENPFLEINREGQSYHELVLLSYEQLPHENLKNCFLYFASFPMGYEIAVWKLIRLWIAEEFIPTIDEWGYHLDMEIEAHKYLNDLVDRNLVMVMSRRVNGQIKTCRIHDSLHEFCKSEAARKNLFRVMDEGQRLDANAASSRRLCFYSSIGKTLDTESDPSHSFFISCYNKKRGTCTSTEHVHTLLLSPLQKGELQLTQQLLTAIPITFPLLRVLDIESIKFESIPDEIYDLHLLRYLAITANLDLLPRQFRKLHELETIVFRTKRHALKIAGGIWNMEKLRHVHTNTSAQLPPLLQKRKNSSESTNIIRTLSTISPACCREEIISKTPKLQKLGIRGNLEELLETKGGTCLFNNLQMLDCLENLKLYGVCDKELKVPMREKFPRRLRTLTLSNTFFHWDDMSILGLLEKLEVLKLDESAFKGEMWDLKRDVVFKQLRYLRIVKMKLETWIASKHSFPVLETLVIRNCLFLKRIPNAFAEINSLKVMELYHVSENATKSAEEVHQKRQNWVLSQAAVDQQSNGKENVKTDQQSHGKENVKNDQKSHGKENVKASAFELFITVLPSQATVLHKQTHDKENVNTSGFDRPSTSLSSQEIDSTVDEFVVGLDGEVKTIMGCVIEGSKNLKVISIVGMMGLGKTTLSEKLLNDYQLQYEFFTRFLIDVSRKNDTKEIFREILKMLTNEENEYDKKLGEVQLVDKIKELLEGKKYFIVMDGVRTMQEWDSLKVAFPDNMRGSRVLITTRNHEVGYCADSACNPHQLKFLTSGETWELVEKKVFGKEICIDESLKTLGRRIATKCNGIPLVAEVIADELYKNRMPDRWKHLADDPFAIIDHMNQECNPLIQLVYDKMNFQLKNCFLYLAAFPIGHKIVTRKLIHLWIAEGFIQLMDGENSQNLECIAEEYLNDLIDRKLLTVSERSADGQTKKCSIHKTLHEFCKAEAAKKNIFHEMDTAKLEANKYIPRRLSVDSSALDFQELGSKVSTEQVRSFIYSCSREGEVLNEPGLAAIAKSFPLLRVMDVESLKFKSLPKELCFLYYLKYLAVSTELKFPPKFFNNLWDMQTLVLKSSQSSLEVEVEIWSMSKLRHVYSNTPMQLSPPPSTIRKNGSGSMDLWTLSTISPSSCTGEIFEMTPNLQKLGIRGNLVEVMASNGGIELFDNLQKLSLLENLKLLNSANDSQTGRLQSIPQHKFPNRLRKLTLSNTSFGWKDMCILGALDELEVLKLNDNAFRGKSWELDSNIVFKQLQFLRIVKADLESWKTSKSCFPVLKTLIIKHCLSLKAVPFDFADVDSLKLLDLYCTTEMAANSARKIEERKRKHDNGNAESCGFELSIYPEHY